MSKEIGFVRSGPLMDLHSYPEWTRELVRHCDAFKRQVVEHELFRQMRDGVLPAAIHQAFLRGGWPVIEQFPQYMAKNLLKVRYGQHRGHDMARRYLIRNIRVEQNHADHWVQWAAASGVDADSLLRNPQALETLSLSHWCHQVCERESLEVAMAATNYAIEGATGEWCAAVCSKEDYARQFPKEKRAKAMKWLALHAHYDDEHPWEALEIIVTLVGEDPSARQVAELRHAICQSHRYMRLLLDHYMSQPTPETCARVSAEPALA
ncbi:pyrroloquinoline quinone (PQQ) biosynthesis protein C [Chromobacterium alkanivorans]|uniref:TenA family transcriptional regulator n=1 Tax=Chromobacterium alkanivorans TaxID=1071719 RepID=UPI00216879BD|nr:iron-containing redox enzyme family protein [Chromobacterium alkanivorans]MCS3803616.1 pyrroloquinoline quinone (PQQ) biosynthesis protein C [Chromobacterium alkanivorans]MCS3818279.1 pyrroloquinoline quinone (PQQ) biosynthesis protein C [Chromobacterium alkanivorans]MCS3874522.1 pyrroloquinoline quinone (PQQ) biosynthesis protein C [Chromobacterium alkanivorans]